MDNEKKNLKYKIKRRLFLMLEQFINEKINLSKQEVIEKIIDVEKRTMDNNQKSQEMINKLLNNDVYIAEIRNDIHRVNSQVERVDDSIHKINSQAQKMDDSIHKINSQAQKVEDSINNIGKYTVKQGAEIRLLRDKIINKNLLKEGGSESVEEVDNLHVENTYNSIDYFDFEDHFRGSRERIKEVQRQYLKYFDGRCNVIDLGCGRGEFLELLKENNITAMGVDSYPEFIEFCIMNNLKVSLGDAIEYLKSVKSTDGIFAGQLVEHLEVSQIIDICNLAYEKLEKGSYIILETPNPTSLAIFTRAFYVDPSHLKPIHPLTLEYYMKKAGFTDVKILYTENSKVPDSIPILESDALTNLDAFNHSMRVVSETLFGSQDYAIIARR